MTDRKQLASLFKQHYREMYRLASIMLHDDAESKDIVHDVFAYILESGKDLKADTAVAYLMTSVRNRCLNRIRNMEIQERVKRLYLEQCERVKNYCRCRYCPKGHDCRTRCKTFRQCAFGKHSCRTIQPLSHQCSLPQRGSKTTAPVLRMESLVSHRKGGGNAQPLQNPAIPIGREPTDC